MARVHREGRAIAFTPSNVNPPTKAQKLEASGYASGGGRRPRRETAVKAPTRPARAKDMSATVRARRGAGADAVTITLASEYARNAS
mmetsp:Transcript_74996/g.229480  ORF Transcript_74996/g.229480 Transcript_74996/m.229480 type:complete len:87 (+) Transcript_74996:800-1060(+)